MSDQFGEYLAHLGDTDTGGPICLNLDRLIGTHACIVANSGGGKSGAIRRLLEETYGHVQHVVLDVEDEFYTLRERYDYAIVGGDGGDGPATLDNAEGLALAVLKHGFSLIAQINDLGEDAPAFVGRFLEALISAPRELWRPLLVVIDETQRFAPSVGNTEATTGVKALLQRGRKRGFTAVLASLALSEINPRVRGLVNNWMLGRVGQALDRDTMARQLGFRPSSPEAMGIQQLPPRTFWAFGPALSPTPTLFRVADVSTTPVRPGQAKVATPPPPEALRAILEGLATAETPAAEGELAVQDAGAEIGHLLIEKHARIRELEAEREVLLSGRDWLVEQIRGATRSLNRILEIVDTKEIVSNVTLSAETKSAGQEEVPPLAPPPPVPRGGGAHEEVRTLSSHSASPTQAQSTPAAADDREYRALAVLAAAAPLALTEAAWAARAGYARKGGAWNRRRARYLADGLIEKSGNKWTATESGLARVGGQLPDFPAPGRALVDFWAGRLGTAPGRVLRRLADLYPQALSRGAIADEVRMAEKGGAFSRAIADLKSAELLEERGRKLRVSPAIMEGDR